MGDERLGRYTILKHLASGGMADVLLGRTDGIEGFERHVVVKRIRAEHAKDQRFIQMFLDEARVAANLHHQNIVQVHDIGESSGEYFFSMEYIHGEDLRKMLSAVSKTGTHMPLGYVVAIMTSTAAGIHYAHERKDSKGKPLNIVHRDVSPSNVLIGYDGSVKVVDFGIAKAAMRQVETRSGSLKGKVSYMSPEQCKGEDIDRRSDVWALGVLLYELATTTRLFKGDNDYLQMDAIVNGKVPPPRSRRPDLPNELQSIIMRALRVDPSKRYQTADELRIALDQFAVRAGLTASTSALAGYMQKLFGERPEPWLDSGGGTNMEAVDTDGPTEAAARASWTELARPLEDEAVTTGPASGSSQDAKTRTDGKRRRSGVASAIALSDTIAPPLASTAAPIAAKETHTSMKMGWEAQAADVVAPPPATPRTKLVLLAAGIPLLALAGIGVWHFALRPQPARPQAASAPVETAPAVTPIAPAPAPAKEIPAVRVAGFEQPEPPPSPPPAASPEPATVTTPTKRSPTTTKAVAAKRAPPPSPALGPAVTPVPAVAPAPQPAVAPTPPPAPPQVEPEMATISNAVISNIAASNARQLAACEGTAELRGDVSVTFEVDATGKVVKSQLASSIKNPKVAGCILKTVQSWKFPRPPTGAAKGVYSISYQ
jgi:eukaryotic-like serine/threonine-protein kinase